MTSQQAILQEEATCLHMRDDINTLLHFVDSIRLIAAILPDFILI
jgi:hypothetical protein